ncbi:MAG: O-antigen ligase family protein [Chloroflexi bacterium]|nr:O-antigen ligase family protein [Chloroflexota bacterium]
MLSTLSENSTKLTTVLTILGIALAVALGALVAFGSPVIAFALVLGVIAAAIVLSNIEYGLYAVIAVAVLLPFGALPINLGFNPTFLDLALIALFAMWVMRGVTRQGGDFVATPLGVPVLVFLVLAVFSFIAGLGHSSVTTQVLRQFVEVLIAITMFFVVVNTVQSRETLKRVIIALILAGFLAAAIGIVFYVLPRNTTIYLLSILRVFKYPSGDGILRFIEDDPANPMRAISTSVDPNVLGGLLILVTALSAPQIFARKPILPRPLAIAMAGTMFLCLVLTFSRGALLGLVMALVVIATVRYRPIIAVILLGGVVFLFLPFTQEYVGHLLDAFTASDRATQMRLGEYKDAFTLIARYPFFGVGFGSSPDIDTYIGVSSVYLLMAEEMGLLGLGAFLITMGMFFNRAAQTWFAGLARDEELAPILLGLAGALLGAMIGGLVDHYFFNLKFVHAAALFWLYVGLGMATMALASRVDKPDTLT